VKFINYYRSLFLDNVRLICAAASQAKGICGSITGYRKIICHLRVFIYNLNKSFLILANCPTFTDYVTYQKFCTSVAFKAGYPNCC
jgi:hypothetical protein